MSHPHEDAELRDAAAAVSSAQVLIGHHAAVAESAAEPQQNWTEMDCGWLDEVHSIQNHFYWRHNSPVLLLSLYAAVCAFGAVINLMVLLSFARVAQLRNTHNYFIANLAVSDLLLCTVTAPVTVYLSLNFFWPFGTLACQIMASIQAVNMFVSCLTLVLIAMDRFLLTLFPVKWRLAARAPLICYLFVWFCSILVAAPYGAAVTAEDANMLDPWNSPHADSLLAICDRSRPQICIENPDTWNRLPFSRRNYTLTVLGIQYILPLAALAVAYSQIGSTIRKRVKLSTTVDGDRKQSMAKRNRKALLLLSCLVIVYAIAWAPMNAYNVLHVLDWINFSQYQYLFCHLIGMVSACLNPLLYALINDSFRAAFLQLIRPLCMPCASVIIENQHGQHDMVTTNTGGGQQRHPRTFSSAFKKTTSSSLHAQQLNNNNNNSIFRSRSPLASEALSVMNGGAADRRSPQGAKSVESGGGGERVRIIETGGIGVAEIMMMNVQEEEELEELIGGKKKGKKEREREERRPDEEEAEEWDEEEDEEEEGGTTNL